MKLLNFWKALHPSQDPVITATYRYNQESLDVSDGVEMTYGDTGKFFEIMSVSVDGDPISLDDATYAITSSDTSVLTISEGPADTNRYFAATGVGSATITIAATYEGHTVEVDTIAVTVSNPEISYTITGANYEDTGHTASIDSSSTSTPTMIAISDVTIDGDSVSGTDVIWTIADTTVASFGGGQATTNGAQAPLFATGTEGTTTITVTAVVNEVTFTLVTINLTSSEISG